MIECTITERRASVGCYVFMEDGTIWCVYDRCQHGISETTPVYHPRVELTNEPPQSDPLLAVQ